MKQKLFIFLFLILLVGVLAGLNAASYGQKEKKPDIESAPNRSTFNTGTTGTQAFYSLLAETRHKVVRWQLAPASLAADKKNIPAVFVVTGTIRREFSTSEMKDLLAWVSDGGRLVLIDRDPPHGLVDTTSNWQMSLDTAQDPSIMTVAASEPKEMIGPTEAVKAVQPTVFTQNVNAIQPSRFASSIVFERSEEDGVEIKRSNQKNATPPPRIASPGTNVPPPGAAAPTVHFASAKKNLLVDAPYGDGRIVILADPYIVSNGGIALADNAQMAINMVAAGDGVIAFDEYHQGYGGEGNQILQFFEGTPVVAIFLQVVMVIGFVFYSQSRRFGRPVPLTEKDRLSKLEYVAAMAEIQNRTKAFDLAIENIFGDFRRRAARYFGIDNLTSTTSELAMLIAERTGLDSVNVDATLHLCEEIIRGEPTNRKEVLRLAAELREIENQLGISRVRRLRI